MDLSEYRLVYEITILPHIIFAGITPASEPFNFDKLELPPDSHSKAIDCRFMLFDKEGKLIDMAFEMAMYINVTAISNITPLKMIKKLIGSI